MTAKYSGVDGYVGNTPLIRLRRLSELTGCEILGKAEFMNPAGSVKDRAAYGIITDAEQQGRLKPSATIVEGTAGNTGIGLAVIGRARGYRTVIVIPNNQSPEKMHLLRTLGAEVKAVPEKPYKDPENYNHIARRLAEERGWFWANQFDNTANRDAHYRSTGPEIWKQTEGKVSSFVAAVGTGGTLAGVSSYLKEQNPNIEIVCADPYGAAMWSWFTNGNLETNDGDSIAEGIGQGRVTKNIEGIKVDRAYRIPDQSWPNDRLPASARRRPVSRLIKRHQRCRSGALRQGIWAGTNDRHRSLRLGPQISINAVQSRLAGFESSRSRSSTGIGLRPLISDL